MKPRRAPSTSLLSPSESPAFPLRLAPSLFFILRPFLTHTLTYTGANSHPAGPVRRGGREMAPVIFPSFKWGSAAVSVTETPRGGHQTKEKPFTLYCPLPQRSHISFLHPSTLFFPPHPSHIPSIDLFLIFPTFCQPHVSAGAL